MNGQYGRTAGGSTGGSLKRGSNARSFGNSANYSQTVPMNFRGQDKKQLTPGQLGNNPNIDPADEYIINLQQQIHFMELELKILREKVTEDEQKSGVGSLFDDDKTSHQHISLLKTKYAQMKRDFDRNINELDKRSLQVKGQEFVLSASLKIVKEQTNGLKETEADFMDEYRTNLQSLHHTTKENTREQFALEGDVRSLMTNGEQQERTHYEHKLYRDIETAFDTEALTRHDLEVKLVSELKAKKEAEKMDLEAKLDQVEKDFLANKEYQGALAEEAQLRDTIEKAKVQIQFLDIQISFMTEANEYLCQKRDDLAGEKLLADMKNEEMLTQFKAQEEIANKRLQNKLNREKSAEVKELLAQDELIKQSNEEYQNKCRSEQENYDNLLRDKIEITEQLDRKTEELKRDTEIVTEQDKILAELKAQIEAEQAIVDQLNEDCESEKEVKKVEQERHRIVEQQNTAFEAKKEFIEANYDYTSNVNDMNLEIFKNIVSSNTEVNETVHSFVDKASSVKKEVSKILASRYTF